MDLGPAPSHFQSFLALVLLQEVCGAARRRGQSERRSPHVFLLCSSGVCSSLMQCCTQGYAAPRRARAHSATSPGMSHKREALGRARNLILEAWERCPHHYWSVYVKQRSTCARLSHGTEEASSHMRFISPPDPPWWLSSLLPRRSEQHNVSTHFMVRQSRTGEGRPCSNPPTP